MQSQYYNYLNSFYNNDHDYQSKQGGNSNFKKKQSDSNKQSMVNN